MTLQNFRTRTSNLFLGSKPIAAGELLIAILIIVGGLVGIIPFSSTPFLLLFGWLMLWLRGVGWRNLGLRRPTKLVADERSELAHFPTCEFLSPEWYL